MAVDTTHNYRLATDDENFNRTINNDLTEEELQDLVDDTEEEENQQEEEDYYDFPKNWHEEDGDHV